MGTKAKPRPRPRPRSTAHGAKHSEDPGDAAQEIVEQPVTSAAPEALQPEDVIEPQTRLQTRKSNQAQHPSERHNQYTIRRRTKEEIAQDELAKAEKLMADRYENRRDHQSRIDFAAQLETNIRQKQQAMKLNATRPDLDVGTIQDRETQAAEDEKGIDDELLSNGNGVDNLPYTSGDDSEHLSIPGETYDEDFDDGKGSDPDYPEPGVDDEVSSDLEADYFERNIKHAALQVTSKKQKAEPGKATKPVSKAAQRAAFRGAVSQQAKQLTAIKDKGATAATPVPVRNTAPAKRKVVSNQDDSNVKRVRQASVGGLRANWKSLVKPVKGEGPGPASNTSSHKSATPLPATSNNDEYASTPTGEFNNDEDIEILNVVQARKGSNLPPSNAATTHKNTQNNGGVQTTQKNGNPHSTAQVRAVGNSSNYIPRSTLQMGIKFEQTDISPAGEATPISGPAKRGSKSETKYTNANLPFSRARARLDLKTWQKDYLPALYDWAGTLPEPFGTNSHPSLHGVVTALWITHFPHLRDVKNDPAIIPVAGAALQNWHSEIGKAGLRVVTESLDSLSKEEIVEFVASQLPTDNQVGRFIYGEPDNEPGHRDAWLSSPILETFAWHVAVTMKVKTSGDYPLGALALCAASVERALRRWETGVCEEIAFSNSIWGAAADRYAQSTATLNEDRWQDILSASLQFATSSKQQEVANSGGQAPSFEMDPRAMITD
ncbi:hypothetical protein BDN71DRAFT_1505952 [Pleurotus eryngii]|uniref:DUF6532 domain-containing protein n=1 Tax=Pleurotus eryngii TaxID=5323 RepID=A0A9P5ZZ02_PLEER|nr:hypothetical protein BDN71DRAFT_1505952 [Pleurotus eryngii]